jgi:hypothetical protein
MGVTYAGWSETIDRYKIPLAFPHKDDPVPDPTPEPHDGTRGSRVERAIRKLRRAKKDAPAGTPRGNKLRRALKILRSIPFLKPKK